MRTRPITAISALALAIVTCGISAPASVTCDDFDTAIEWGRDAVAREDFAEAQYDYEKACDAAMKGPRGFDGSERTDLKARLADLRQLIGQRKASELSTPEGVQRLEAAERHWRSALGNETFATARMNRQREVAALIKKARGFTDDAQYNAAIGVIKQILVLDSRNDYAIGVRPLLEDRFYTFEQRKFRERFDTDPPLTPEAPEAHLASSADWLIIPLAVVLPMFWARFRARGRSRASHGMCLTCGYDLRATRHRCPECGTVPIAGKAGT